MPQTVMSTFNCSLTSYAFAHRLLKVDCGQPCKSKDPLQKQRFNVTLSKHQWLQGKRAPKEGIFLKSEATGSQTQNEVF